jgi:ankyrin repeat protein
MKTNIFVLSDLVQVRNNEGNTALHLAAIGGSTLPIQTWIKAGGKIDQKMMENYLQVIALLVEEGRSDLEAKNCGGSAPLHLAASTGNVFIIEKLLELGADKEAKDFNGNTGKTNKTSIKQSVQVFFCKHFGVISTITQMILIFRESLKEKYENKQ